MIFETKLITHEPETDLSREWLETNELGDYASSTAAACNTRRYHGLFTANIEGMGRHVLLSTVEDWLVTPKEKLPLSTRSHPGTFYPHGARSLASAAVTPCPSFTYRFGKITVRREVMLVREQHILLLRYSLEAPKQYEDEQLVLRVAPLLAFRNFHSLHHANMNLQVKTFPATNGFKIQPYNSLPPLYMQTNSTFRFSPSPDWIYNVEYPVERERGFDCAEDLFSPGLMEIAILPGMDVYIAVSMEDLLAGKNRHDTKYYLSRLWKLVLHGHERRMAKKAVPLEYLKKEGNIFLETLPSGEAALLAGYHWFDSWGRDTLIALPGLTFFADRAPEGLEVLRRVSRRMRDGLVPNTFTADGRPQGYNCVDASLWYGWTVQNMLQHYQHAKEAKDMVPAFRKEFAPRILEIIDAFRGGRIPFAFLDSKGFLDVGTPRTQLTWMDAQVDGMPVTPRNGQPVEVEALWYNLLALGHQLFLEVGGEMGFDDPAPAPVLREMRRVFAERFLKADGSLRDVWRSEDEGGPDDAERPNQLFAIALPHAVLEPDLWAGVLDAVSRDLLTPYGLRTLAPSDPAFCPAYGGGSAERDGAYHQGTVWPWLLGAYADALMRTVKEEMKASKKSSAAPLDRAVKQFLATITPLVTTHLCEAGIGHVSEIFSATEPYRPDGCIAQAWSTGELVRALRTMRNASRTAYEAWEKKARV